MAIARRDMMLAGLSLGVGLAAGPRSGHAGEPESPQAFSSFGLVPRGGDLDQTATLQEAADAAAQSGTPLFVPPGIYATSKLELKSGTQLKGVPGKSILRYRDGGGLLGIGQAQDVRLEGLVLDGASKPLGDGGALLMATGADRLVVVECRSSARTGTAWRCGMCPAGSPTAR